MDYRERLHKNKKARERKRQIEQGFFDGRFQSKTIPNKKKAFEKKASRRKFSYTNFVD